MSKSKTNRILRSIGSVTGLVIFSKALGFVKQMVTASVFGATAETDVFNLAQGFVGTLHYIIVQTLSASMISIYLHTRERSETEAKGFVTDTVKAFTVISGGITAIIALFAPWIARVIAPTYSGEKLRQLVVDLRLLSVAVVLFSLVAIFHATLDAHKRFVPGQLEGANQSVILILLVILFHKRLGVQTLVLAYFAYTVWNALFLGVLSRKYRGPSRGNPFANPGVRELLRMIFPLLFSYSALHINQMIDQILVSGLDEGFITAMSYASVLSNLVGTFVTTIVAVLFTYITTNISRGEHEKVAGLTVNAASLMLIVFLPISILTVICAEDIVAIAYGRGAFGAESVRVTATALRGYAFFFFPFTLRELFSRFQYGYKDSRRPMINSVISVAINIVLSIVLCPHLGVFGVTFASSVSVYIAGALNAVSAKRHNEYLKFTPLLRQLPVMAVGGAVCAALALWCNRFWPTDSSLLRFALTTLCAGGAYLLIETPVLLKLLRTYKHSV